MNIPRSLIQVAAVSGVLLRSGGVFCSYSEVKSTDTKTIQEISKLFCLLCLALPGRSNSVRVRGFCPTCANELSFYNFNNQGILLTLNVKVFPVTIITPTSTFAIINLQPPTSYKCGRENESCMKQTPAINNFKEAMIKLLISSSHAK